MVEVLATLRANDKHTGERVGKAEIIVTCDECEDLDEFTDEHGEAVAEYLYNVLESKTSGREVVYLLLLVELEDDDEDEGDDGHNMKFVPRWL